jgi:hypothetical protein
MASSGTSTCLGSNGFVIEHAISRETRIPLHDPSYANALRHAKEADLILRNLHYGAGPEEVIQSTVDDLNTALELRTFPGPEPVSHKVEKGKLKNRWDNRRNELALYKTMMYEYRTFK